MSGVHENIRMARIKARMKGQEVANILGIAKSTMSNYESGARGISIDVVMRLSEIYGVSVYNLIGIKDPYDTSKKIPILESYQSDKPLINYRNVVDYIDLPEEYTDKGGFFALLAAGDSMNGSRICDGDIVIARIQNSAENGEIVVVSLDDEKFSIKKYYRANDMVTLMPNSTNPVHQAKIFDIRVNPVQILGKVVEVKIKL